MSSLRVKITSDAYGTSYIAGTVSDALVFLETEFDCADDDRKYTITFVEMTDEEYAALDEFDGF